MYAQYRTKLLNGLENRSQGENYCQNKNLHIIGAKTSLNQVD
jgi:hypothetical protein